AERIRDVDIAGWISRWLARPGNAHSVAQRAASVLQQALRSLPREDVNAFLTRAARYGIENMPAAPLASRLLALVWAHGEMQTLIEHGITYASAALVRNRGTIRQKVSERSSRLIPKWVDGIMADRLVAGLTRALDEMREPNHPWRIELSTAVEKLVADLATNPDMLARGEELKAQILENPVVARQIDAMWG